MAGHAPPPAPCSASRHGPGSQLYIIQYGYSSPLGKGPRSGHGTLNPPVTLGAASLPPIHGSRGCPSVLSLPAPGSPQGLLGGHRIHALLGPGGGRVSTHLRPSPGPYLVTHSVTQLDQPRAATASGLIWPPGRAAPSWSSTLPPPPPRNPSVPPGRFPARPVFPGQVRRQLGLKLDNVALSDRGSQPATGWGPWPLAEEGASPGAVGWH